MTTKISKLASKIVCIFFVVLILIILRQEAALLFDEGKLDSLSLLLQQGCRCQLTGMQLSVTHCICIFTPANILTY
jgi:hypothetical protein